MNTNSKPYNHNLNPNSNLRQNQNLEPKHWTETEPWNLTLRQSQPKP